MSQNNTEKIAENLKNMTEKDWDQLDRILDKFMAMTAEKQEKVLKEADRILKEDK